MIMRNTLLTACAFFLICFFCSVHATNPPPTEIDPPIELLDAYNLAIQAEDVPEQVRAQMRIGTYYEEAGDFGISEYYYRQVLLFSYQQDYMVYVGNILNSLALLCRYRGEYKTSLQLCLEAIKIETQLGYDPGISLSYYNMGTVFYKMGNYEKVLEYMEKSRPIDLAKKDKTYYTQSRVLKALALTQLGKEDSALQEMEGIYPYIEAMEDSSMFSMYHVNVGFIYDFSNRNRQALDQFRIALRYTNLVNDPRGAGIIYHDMAEEFLYLKAYDSATYWANKSLAIAQKLGVPNHELELWEIKAKIARGAREYEEAFAYFDQFLALQTEILNEEHVKVVEELETRYEVEEKEKDLVLKQQRIQLLTQEGEVANFRIYALVACAAFFLVLGILAYAYQKRKRKSELAFVEKERELENAQKNLVELELQKTAIINQQLQAEIEYKNQEMQNLAHHIVQKNELLQVLKTEIKTGARPLSNQLIQLITVGIDTEKEEFEQRVDHINSLFYKKIKDHFPELTDKDLRLLSLIKIKMSSKDISILLNINSASVDMARYRIRKKMGLAKEVNLMSFLTTF